MGSAIDENPMTNDSGIKQEHDSDDGDCEFIMPVASYGPPTPKRTQT